MDDRIGDLLAERARLGGGAGAGIAFSVLVHGSIAAVIVYTAMHAAAPQMMPTLNIQFAPMPRVVSRESGLVAPAPRQPASERLKIPEPAVEPPKPVVKSEPRTVPLSAFGQSHKKGSENPAAPTPHTPLPTPAAPGIDIPIGSAGVTGLEGGDFPYTIYIDRMKALIGQHWLRPQTGSGIVTTVSFTINRDGSIRDAKNEIPSADGTFDRAALRAVLEASPLPPLPFGYNGTYLGVHLTFR
ncbi:MAG: TonB family protein [Thermoanaerobaculia bacterium]